MSMFLCPCLLFLAMKIISALISMLMYSCLHLTFEYTTANYHYAGRKIRALSEVLSVETKRAHLYDFGIKPQIKNQHAKKACASCKKKNF